MIHSISVANMRESDRLTIEHYTPSLTLMYRAAMGVYLAADWPGETVIAAGGGNNGGDGYALACILRERGHSCRVVALSEHLSPDSAHFAAKAKALGIPFGAYAPGSFSGCDTIVDCLLGTGFSGEVREPYGTAIGEINASGARVVSVDINSGMNGDTGEAGIAVRSDLTVTIAFVKNGLITENAGKYIARLVCADIGIVLDHEENRICAADEQPAEAAAHEKVFPAPPWLDMTPIDVRDTAYAGNGRLKRILCLGNSNTYGYDPRSWIENRYPIEVRWTGRLQGVGLQVLNKGMNGSSIPTRGEIPVMLDMISAEKPLDAVTMMFGTNDVLRGGSAETAGEHMAQFLRAVKEEIGDAALILIAPPPVTYGDWVQDASVIRESGKLAAYYREIAAEQGVHFADAGEWGVGLAFDGVHFTEEGHTAFFKGIYQVLQGL